MNGEVWIGEGPCPRHGDAYIDEWENDAGRGRWCLKCLPDVLLTAEAREKLAALEEQRSEPDPSRVFDVHACTGCGAISDPEGNALDNRCVCPPGRPHERVPLIPPLNTPDNDPTTGVPNEYVKRLKQRVAADTHYLQVFKLEGHEVAAETTCAQFGHDARAGRCLRCGARVGRIVE